MVRIAVEDKGEGIGRIRLWRGVKSVIATTAFVRVFAPANGTIRTDDWFGGITFETETGFGHIGATFARTQELVHQVAALYWKRWLQVRIRALYDHRTLTR
ncbi:MAG: hypothetical protein SRB2_01934 [Desulfobacteraceae bacterium Eth-SRB2]|nr:MAG: hypothetical protein SRB2_01934 [Desulfobacteraceae bacterium Eth-SRB2]